MRPVLLLVLVTACTGLGASRREDVPTRPLDLDPRAPLPVAGKCTWPGRVASPGAIPAGLAPQLEQGLELVELRGDLRLSAAEDNGARAWSHDGKRYAIGESSGVLVWDATTGALRGVIPLVAVSPDDRFVAAASGRRVDLWTRSDWRPQIDITHDQPVTRLAFSGDGRELATADEGGVVRVTRTLDGKRLGRLRLPYDRVLHLWLSADGSQLEVDTARGLRVRARLNSP